MRKRMFSARHLIVTAVLVVAGLTGVVAGGSGLLEAAPDTWSMPALEPGMHAEYTYTAFSSDSVGTQLGATRTLFAVDVMEPSTMLDANGKAHMADGYKITLWGHGVRDDQAWAPQFALVAWFDDLQLLALDVSFSDDDILPRNSSQLGGLLQTQTSASGSAGWRSYMDPTFEDWTGPTAILPCGTAGPFQGKSLTLREIPRQPCMFLNLPADPGTMANERPEETGTRIILPHPTLRVLGVVDEGSTLVVRQKGDGATLTMWLPSDQPFASRMVWSEGGIDHVISLSEFSTRPATAADLPARGDVPLPAVRPLVDGLPDDRGVDHPFPASQAWEAALRDERVAGFAAQHPDARIFRLEYSPALGWSGAAWRFSVAGDGEDLGVRVALEEDNLYALVWPELRFEVSTFAPRDSPDVPLASYPTEAPAVAGMLATVQAMGPEIGDWGWLYEVGCEAWRVCDTLVGQSAFVSETRDSETGVDPHGPGIVTNGTLDIVLLEFAPDGRLAGGAFLGMETTSRSGLAATGPPPATPAAQAPTPPDPALPNLALAAGSLSLLAALAYFLWPVAKQGAVGLFSRVQPSKTLDHPTRARIAELISAQPGIHGHDIARTTGLHRSTVDHHVRKLIEGGHVTKHRAGGYTCYFPRGTDRRLHAAAPVLKSETARKILHHLQASPGATAAEVAQALGISRSTVAYHIGRMEEAGVLQGDRRGASIALTVRDVPVAA